MTGFFDPGFAEVQGRTIHCWKHGGHGSQSFVEVVENSCNTGFVTVGLRLGRDIIFMIILKPSGLASRQTLIYLVKRVE